MHAVHMYLCDSLRVLHGVTAGGSCEGPTASIVQVKRSEESEHPFSLPPEYGLPFEGSVAYLAPANGVADSLCITFQMLSKSGDYKCKAQDYWAEALGHEGPGSLLSALKARKLATALEAGENTRNWTWLHLPLALMQLEKTALTETAHQETDSLQGCPCSGKFESRQAQVGMRVGVLLRKRLPAPKLTA
jgi:hypothetical protein